MTGTAEAWGDIARGYHGKAKIFYSPDGRKPRQVRGAVPVQVVKKWVKACGIKRRSS